MANFLLSALMLRCQWLIFPHKEKIFTATVREHIFDPLLRVFRIKNLEITTKAFLDGKEPSEIRLLFDEQDKMVNTPQYKTPPQIPLSCRIKFRQHFPAQNHYSSVYQR